MRKHVFVLLLSLASTAHADWPQFRGVNSAGLGDTRNLPAEFGPGKNELWSVPLPSGHSSPIIIGDRVILYRGNLVDHFLLAVDKHTGDELWRVDQQEPFHIELACTTCPIVHGDNLIVHTARSVQAFDLDSGKHLVTKCATTATSTPVLAVDEVLVAAWNKMGEPALRPEFPSFDDLVQQYDKDADNLITSNDMGDGVYATPAAIDETLYVRTHSRLYAFGLEQ